MIFFSSLFKENPAETFAYFLLLISVITIILISISFYYDYKKKIDFQKQMSAFDRSLKDLVEEFRTFELLFTDQKKILDEYKFILNDTQQEISRLADSLKNEKNITSAITLAKEGLTVEEISNQTGISTEEVEPIVRYHGKN